MAEKHTTLEQLKLSVLRGKAEILSMLIDALGGVQVGMTITLPATGWSGGALTVQHESFLADSSYWYFVCGKIDVDADDVTVDGQMTFQCRNTPGTDLTVNIFRLEVETDDDFNTGKVFNLIANADLRDYVDQRFSDFYNAFINDQPIYFSLCDSDSKAIQDSENKDLTGLVIFQANK